MISFPDQETAIDKSDNSYVNGVCVCVCVCVQCMHVLRICAYFCACTNTHNPNCLYVCHVLISRRHGGSREQCRQPGFENSISAHRVPSPLPEEDLGPIRPHPQCRGYAHRCDKENRKWPLNVCGHDVCGHCVCGHYVCGHYVCG